jgi:O-antigen/teichoic acid export membrane protein
LSISQFIFPLITFPYASRILGPRGIGAVNFIDSLTQYFLLFAALGVPIYGVREIAKVKDERDALNKTFSEIFIIHICSTGIFSVLYIGLILLIPMLHAQLDLVFIGLLILAFGFLSLEWFFQGMEKFSYITKRTLLVRVSSIFLLFIFLKPGSQPFVYYAVLSTVYVFTGIINFFSFRNYVSIVTKDLNFKKHIKPLSIILGSTLAISVYIYMDNVILGFIKGESAVGYYSTAIRIVKIPFAFITAISAVMIPRISQAFKNGQIDSVRSLIDRSFNFICIVGIPIAFGIFVCSEFLIRTFAGEGFLNAITPLRILTPVILLVGMSNICGIQLLTPFGKEKLLLKAVLGGMLFSLVANFCLIPFFSFIGAAITNVLTETIVTLLTFFAVKKYIKISFDKRIFLQCFLGSAFFFPIALLIEKINLTYILQEVLIILSCILFYSVYVVVFVRNKYVDSIRISVFKRLSLTRIKF